MQFFDSAKSPIKVSTQENPWNFILISKDSFDGQFNDAYKAMLEDKTLLIFSPVKSPKGASAAAGAGAGADADPTTKGEYEDQLSEVAIDDTFTYNSYETGASCDDDGNGKTGGGGDCGGKRGSETREHVKSESDEDETKKIKSEFEKAIYEEGSGSPAIIFTAATAAPASTTDEQPKGWIDWLIEKLDANRRDMFGGRSTRKRKRSKIPRRTIRRRAQKRTQKRKPIKKPRRTIRRRQRRNKKGTQKRRK